MTDQPPFAPLDAAKSILPLVFFPAAGLIVLLVIITLFAGDRAVVLAVPDQQVENGAKLG